MGHYNPITNKWTVDDYAEAAWGAQLGPAVLSVHSPDRCAGRHCVVHNPSVHHMSDWKINFRGDTGVTERICPGKGHGIGHPDPDDLAYQKSVGRGSLGVHGCDGCCFDPEREADEATD